MISKTLFDSIDLTMEDWDMIIDGVDNLRMKGFPGEMMDIILGGMSKPKEEASQEEKDSWEEHRRMRDLERQMKRDKQEEVFKKVDLLKAKLILLRESIKGGQW